MCSYYVYVFLKTGSCPAARNRAAWKSDSPCPQSRREVVSIKEQILADKKEPRPLKEDAVRTIGQIVGKDYSASLSPPLPLGLLPEMKEPVLSVRLVVPEEIEV